MPRSVGRRNTCFDRTGRPEPDGLHCHDPAIEALVREVDKWWHLAHEDRDSVGGGSGDLMLTGPEASHAALRNKLKSLLEDTCTKARALRNAIEDGSLRMCQEAPAVVVIPAHLAAQGLDKRTKK